MAIIRSELISIVGADTRIYDAIIETAADLIADSAQCFGIGSMAYCLEDKKIYVKRTDGAWTVAGEAAT